MRNFLFFIFTYSCFNKRRQNWSLVCKLRVQVTFENDFNKMSGDMLQYITEIIRTLGVAMKIVFSTLPLYEA